MSKESMKNEDQAPIIAYKGFDKNWQCRGYQFAVGETFTHDGNVEACKSGFHACENPLDVLNYYDLCDSKFAIVEQSGKTSRHDEDTKIASAVITIKAEIKLPEFIKRSIEWMMGNTSKDVNAASGDSSKLAASGDYSQLAASGDSSQLAASGYSSQLAASGDSSKLAASGDSSKLAASGDYSQLAASGDSSKLAASGDSSKLAASGDYSQLAASGYSSKLAASGDYSVIASSGKNSTAKIGENGAMCLAWHDGVRPRFTVAYEGENGIKADTWYCLNENGEFIEAKGESA